MEYPKAFDNMIECFKQLPGIGTKGAERLAYYVLTMDKEKVQHFAEVLSDFQGKIQYCKQCGNICDSEICDICADATRDATIVCVVEHPRDVYAMEKIKEYRGLYHVLHGTMSMIDGRTMDDLNIASLYNRMDEHIKEVIIATNPTREGETTALYLAKILQNKGINASRIANGLPIGSNIDYADELTLLKSLEGRKKI